MYKLLFSSIFSLSLAFCSFGQEVVASDGGFFENSEGSLAFTVGEITTETIENTNGIFTQGFQQNFENFLGINSLFDESNFHVFPNPFNDQLTIQWSANTIQLAKLRIDDAYGKTIHENDLIHSQASPLMVNELADLAPGIYYLTLFIGKSSEPLLFKVIKK